MKTKKILNLTLKIGAWILGSVAVLLVLAMCAVAWILTPERLTPIVNRIANDNLNAKVNIGRVELTAWSTFPDLVVDIDSLSVISGSLKGLQPDSTLQMPEWADSLVEASHVHGGVNVLRLLYGTIALKDLSADNMRLNLVYVNETTANYLISLPS